ncbi:MAG: transposase [Saprospiraceae bacterium]
MLTLPKEFSGQISVFAPLFNKKVFEHAKVLILGALLVVGRRTVCSALRAVGLGDDRRFHKYHRVLSKARWCGRQCARLLLLALVLRFAQEEAPLVFGIDETIERRRGQKIKAKGIYRDGVRSSKSHMVKCSGLRWMSLMLLSPISWADRVWALPFMTVLAPSERYNLQQGKRHKRLTDWARQMLLQLHRWLPKRLIIIVADASYAVLDLLDAVRSKVCLITRLRLDAALYEFAPPRSKGKRGPRCKKGNRLPTLQQMLQDPGTKWTPLMIPHWYGQRKKTMLITTGKAIWYHTGKPPVPIRWVLVKPIDGGGETAALLSTNLNLSPLEIINFFIRRWTMEVTFEEARAHLGVESQRQWSDLAIARTTPALFGLFSLVALWADNLQVQNLLHQRPTAWYKKIRPTFSDAIASVRYRIWRKQKFSMSYLEDDIHNLNSPWIKHLISMAIRAA